MMMLGSDEMERREDQQYIKMTETPIPKLVIGLGIPTTISMLITNLYNMADTYFVSQISVSASGATGIVFSLMAILQAFGFMYGHGAGSNISRLLGSKQIEKAKVYTSTSAFLAIFTGLIIGILGLVFLKPLMLALGSTSTILNDAMTYGFFILIAAPAFVLGCVLNNILRYEGKAVFSMIGLTTGGILNMILDPILIFGFNMGVAGAGAATAISQYISMSILLVPYLTNKTITKIHYQYFAKEFYDIKNIITCGLPTLTRQGLNSVSTTVLNIQASVYGDVAIAAMSVVARVSNLLFSFALGIAQGFQPVSAYNYGAKKYDRVKKATYFTMAFGFCTLAILCSICYMNASLIISLFRDELEIIEIGTTALRFVCLTLAVLPLSAVSNMCFQSIGKSFTAFVLACLQGGLVFIPLVMILPHFIGITGIQIAQPLAYIICTCVSVPTVINFFKQIENNSN